MKNVGHLMKRIVGFDKRINSNTATVYDTFSFHHGKVSKFHARLTQLYFNELLV